jgi:hypothetical protein
MPYAWEAEGLNDAQRMALFDKITDPLEMLCCVNEGEQWFGDNYYRDITNCIWKNVNRVINLSTEKEQASGN